MLWYRVLPDGVHFRDPDGGGPLLFDSEIPRDGHRSYRDPHARSALRLRSDAHPLLYRCPNAGPIVYWFDAVCPHRNPGRLIPDLLGHARGFPENDGEGGGEGALPQNARR